MNFKTKVAKLCFSEELSVSDDWAPNYPDNKVKAKISSRKTSSGYFVIFSISGMDDCGAEMIFYSDNYESCEADFKKAKQIYNNLKSLEPIDLDYLMSIGFERW